MGKSIGTFCANFIEAQLLCFKGFWEFHIHDVNKKEICCHPSLRNR